MQEPTERALKLLNLLASQTGKEERLTELLRDPESGATPGWSIHVPTCFNDALDIRQTQRKADGKAVSIWTQGSNFGFRPGDVLYDTPQAYQEWSEALKHVNLCIQVKTATPNSSGGSGGTSTSGTVTFDILKPTASRKALAFEASHSLSEEAFVRFLAYSDETGHPFRSMSDSVPTKPDSNRSEATLRVCDKGVSGLSQGFRA